MRPGTAAAIAGGALAVLLFATSARARTPPRTRSSLALDPANQVPVRTTSPATSSEWMRTRLAMARAHLAQMFPAIGSASREQIARNMLAHWWRETGRMHEVNYAVGNIKAFPGQWRGRYHRLPNGSNYRAYANLSDAVHDYINLISGGRYASSWAHLVADPSDVVGWYEQLLSAGYSRLRDTALRQIESLRRSVDASVGAA